MSDLLSIPGVGYEVAKSIVDFFKNEENRKIIKRLLDAGITFEKEEKVEEEKPKIFEGLTFVFTGALKSMTRSEAKKKVIELGGKVTESVSRNVDYVVVGENPGSKYRKAQQLGVKTINEKEFLEMLNQAKRS